MKKILRRVFVNRSQITNNLGFTLIELLIVVTMIIIFSGLSLAYYNNFTQEQQLKTEARKLIDVLELAKKKAASGDLSGLNCDGFQGYEVNIQPNNYFLNLRCINPQISQLARYNFSNTNIFVQSGTGLFRFQPLASGLIYKANEQSNPSNPPTIQIKNNFNNKCFSIDISSIGVINFNEALSSC